jgi:Tfp pilus assembly protein PilF
MHPLVIVSSFRRNDCHHRRNVVRNDSEQVVPPEHDGDYQDALRCHQQGDLAVAERAYREILRRDPNHSGAWHFWGVIGLVRGDYASARKRLERALLLCDTKAVYWNNYGVLLKETGDYRAAEGALHRALDLNRQYADAWSNLGHLQHLLRRPPGEVEQSLRNALALAADHVDATFHLADLYQACGRHADAVAQYWRGLQHCRLAPTGSLDLEMEALGHLPDGIRRRGVDRRLLEPSQS